MKSLKNDESGENPLQRSIPRNKIWTGEQNTRRQHNRP